MHVSITNFVGVGVASKCLDASVKDVVFVIDMSGSIGSDRFQMIREFVGSITTNLISGSPNSSIAVVLFANNAHIQFNLQAHTNLSTLLPAINRLPYNGGQTYTDMALRLLLSSAQSGALGLRNSSSNVAVIITDGKSNNPSKTSSAATALHASKLFDVYTVGVGGADLTELQRIASSPKFVFFTSFFDSVGFQLLENRILHKLCNSEYPNKVDNGIC